ncbi:zinc finger protein rotund-like isoform X2 [Cydia pomonella]|uniref:zinc finger protein rotund-like isoform X2 n=1 Tax=Cydia pomonella TaxID=82600 RepID=UPI002ADE22B8|nr:zinc finger protein rotund-like isoform X2 [Cydia pomonella]
MSVTVSNSNVFIKNPMNLPMKTEFEEYSGEDNAKMDQIDNNSSDANSESSDLENNGPNEEANNTALDFTENAFSLHPVADFIKKEFLPDFDFANPFRSQNFTFKDGFQNARSPFLLPTQLYKNFLVSLGKRRRNVAECYSLYQRNMLFSNGFGLEMSDDENNVDRTTESPDEKAGASSAFVWSGGGGQEQAAPQPAAVPTGTSGGGGAQGLVHWMSVMAEHMGGGHHDPSHYALPPWNNGGVDAKMSTGDGTVGGHQKADDRLGHHQSMSQMLYGAGLGPGRSGSSSSSPVGGTNTGSGLLVVPQPLGKGPAKLQPLHAHARKYHCKMCPQVFGSKADLQLHTQIHLREAKPYRCTQCPKAFANSSYLAQHSRIHLGIKPYRCEICQRKFTQLSHLQQHIRTHTGDKPYRCTQIGCTKAFSQLSNLQSHSRCHQTDKPFKCNSCYKCFTHEKDLLEHIPKHKESKHLKTHICQYCGKSYTQETYLSKHMNKHAERADKRPPISALGLSGLNRSLAAAAPTATPFGDHPYWPKVSPDSAAHMSDDGGYHQQREEEHHEQQLQQHRALFAQHEAQEERSLQPPVSSAANSAFTPINSMAPHLNGLSHHSALPARPYLYDPLHFQQGKQQPNSFPNQLISLHQIRNYAHQPSAALLPAEHILPHALSHKDKQ